MYKICNAFINDVVRELQSGFFSFLFLSFFFRESTFSLTVNGRYIGNNNKINNNNFPADSTPISTMVNYNLISKIDSFKESKIFYIDGDFGRNFPLRNDLPNLEQSLFYLFIYLFLVLEPTFEYLLR